MKRLYIFILFSACLLFLSAQSVYYYELVDGKGDGHFISINNKSCFDSDAKGESLGNGVRLYKGEQNNQKVYRGMSAFGDACYYFSQDFSRLKIVVTKGNIVYNYIRKTAPKGAVSAHGAVQSPSNGVQPYIPPTTPTVYPSYTPYSTTESEPTNTKRKCPDCGGTGICSICHGRGYRKNMYSGKEEKCPWCNGTGQCKVCYGKGYCY